MTALGLGKVGYDARIDGFAWPQQATIGLGYRPWPRLLLALDYNWIDWSSTHDQLTIVMTSPGIVGAPPTITMPMALNWRDQHVIKAGVEYQATDALAVRFGVNYGRRPMRDVDTRTQFPAIAEIHYTAGLGWRSGDWELGLAVEHVPEVSVVNNSVNPAVNIFGPGSKTTLQQTTVSMSVARKF